MIWSLVRPTVFALPVGLLTCIGRLQVWRRLLCYLEDAQAGIFGAMQEFDAKLLDTIEQVADYFAERTVQEWIQNIKKKKIVNTRQLLNSLDSDTRADLGRMVTVMQFSFEEYGRYLDIKKKRWTEQPPVGKILEWVEKKGLASFGPDPYPNKTKPKTPERRKNEIAWGIARSIAIKRTGPKRKPWFQSTLYKSLNVLYEELSLGVQDRTVEDMKAALTDRLKRGSSIKVF